MQTIEKELLARLENGIYDGIYNLPFNKFIETLDTDELQAEDENEEVCLMEHVVLCIIQAFCIFLFPTDNYFGNKQESEVEYVEGNFELEEEDDIEDMGMKNYHISNGMTFVYVVSIFVSCDITCTCMYRLTNAYMLLPIYLFFFWCHVVSF